MMKSVEKSGKTIDIAVGVAIAELGVSRDEVDIQVIDEGSRGLFGIGQVEPRVRVSLKNTPPLKVKCYLENVLEKMGLDAELSIKAEDETVYADVSGESMGLIIGRRGDTLDALQYLCSLVANRGEEHYVRVTVDTENYRDKREQTLVSLAKRMAGKVSRSGVSMTLEPMNPNERRIIHSTLQEYRNVSTYSTGEEPNRRVVVTPKDRKNSYKGSYEKRGFGGKSADGE